MTKLFEETDVSGLIRSAVFVDRVPPNRAPHNDIEVPVDNDMLVVGGGAFAEGAFLTASFPNEQRTAWRASSKDHQVPNPHFLTGYAIGIKVAGLTRDDLLAHVRYRDVTSNSANHPMATSSEPPAEFMLISGGFQVNWKPGAGNLATATYPEFPDLWTSASADHIHISPATITTHAIFIRRMLPLPDPDTGDTIVREVGRTVRRRTSGRAHHPTTSIFLNDDPNLPLSAITGIGAAVIWTATGPVSGLTPAGSLLTMLDPTITSQDQIHQEPGVQAESRDHVAPSIGQIRAWVIGIWLEL